MSLTPSIAILAFALAAQPTTSKEDACAVRSGDAVVPLVELYTSEGCSSCPPADRWLSRRITRGDANWLAFHVDYWDDIGWPDRFASPEYSRRQRDRVGAAGSRTVYTPQVMAGADVNVDWRSDTDVENTLRKQHGMAAGAGLALRLQPQGEGVRVHLGAMRVGDAENDAASLWLAQYVDARTTQVRSGENRGVALRHDRVVRHLWGPWPLSRDAVSRSEDLALPSGAWGMVAFVQDAHGRTLQSLHLPADACRLP